MALVRFSEMYDYQSGDLRLGVYSKIIEIRGIPHLVEKRASLGHPGSLREQTRWW